MPQNGLIGYTGFVGTTLYRSFAFDATYNTQNIQSIRGQPFDLLVCAAPQAKKWWANQNPDEDSALIAQLIDHLKTVQVQRFILTSTIDVFPSITDVDETFDCASHPNHAYGQNRLRFEEFISQHFPVTHIVRLPGLFGPGLKKNIIFDFLHRNQLEKINPESRFQWYDVTQLWDDLQTIQANDLGLVMLATEPVKTADINTRFFPDLKIGMEAAPTISYNVKTCHAEFFGGKDGYIQSQEQVLTKIGNYVHHYSEACT
jgi:hypothetical protein